MTTTQTTQRISAKGLALLKEFEGLSLSMYRDAAGFLSIGLGHKLTEDELKTGIILIEGKPVKYIGGITQAQAVDLEEQDLGYTEEVINHFVRVNLNQNQLDALVCLVFNIGTTDFLDSTLLKKINLKQFAQVPNEFKRWNKITVRGKKVISKGLSARREKEAALWTST